MNAILQPITGHPDIESATYSAEDNKLRLYPACRLDADLYQRVKAEGFKWAPKQELFVAPAWTPYREDLCIELAGEITAEQTTVLERAQAKAERLDELSSKRLRDADAFARTADQIAERFAGGQPILIGHHSERRARKDQKRMHSAMDKSVNMRGLSNYWAMRAEGVERHANRVNSDRTRANRIKKLFAELRKHQRALNFAAQALDIWIKLEESEPSEARDKAIAHYAGASSKDGSMTGSWDTWGELHDGKVTHDEVVTIGIAHCETVLGGTWHPRWITHILNRLSFERAQLGDIPRFEGEITNTILQTFAREQGADKPKARQVDGAWLIESPAPFPLHLTGGKDLKQLALFDDEARALMQACGHMPITKEQKAATRPNSAPLLNYRCEKFERESYRHNGTEELTQVEMTKAEYQKIYKDHRFTLTSMDKSHRIRGAFISAGGGSFRGNWHTVFLTDSKEHPAPEAVTSE